MGLYLLKFLLSCDCLRVHCLGDHKFREVINNDQVVLIPDFYKCYPCFVVKLFCINCIVINCKDRHFGLIIDHLAKLAATAITETSQIIGVYEIIMKGFRIILQTM